MISAGSEVVPRPKKFFKSKNTSSALDNDFEPIQATVAPPMVVAAPKPSKFFKSKSQSNTSSSAPLRPLEVTPNQPLPAPPSKEKAEEVMKVPPLKLRLKAGALMQQPPVPPPVVNYQPKKALPPKPVLPLKEKEDSAPEMDEDESEEDIPEDDHEISFKEPSLIMTSPPQNNILVPSPVRDPTPSPPPPPKVRSPPARTTRRLRQTRAIVAQQRPVPKEPEVIPEPKEPEVIPEPKVERLKLKLPTTPSPPKKEPSPEPEVQKTLPVHEALRQTAVPTASNGAVPTRSYGRRALRNTSPIEPETKIEKCQAESPPPVKEEIKPISSPPDENISQPEALEEASVTSNGSARAPPRSYTRRTKASTNLENEQPETKKFKPDSPPPEPKEELKEEDPVAPIQKSLSLTTDSSRIESSNESSSLMSSELTRSASVPTSNENIMPPPPAESKVFPRPKKSIFKSKANGGQRKGMSLYKHSFGAAAKEKEEDDIRQQKVFHKAITGLDFDEDEDDFGGSGPSPSEMSFSANKLTRVTSETASAHPDISMQEVVSVKCPKAQKEYFTVIKNVKKAHQIQDSGEFQEFNDDVEYIMEGLQVKHTISTRCLSTVTLATKCMEPSFR